MPPVNQEIACFNWHGPILLIPSAITKQKLSGKFVDNFQINVVSKGKQTFAHALAIAVNHAPGNKATHYEVHKTLGLILYWHLPNLGAGRVAYPFPFTMSLQVLTDFVWEWLLQTEPSTPEPDHDGSNSRGFCVYTGAWGAVESSPYSFVAIRPEWAMHGK